CDNLVGGGQAKYLPAATVPDQHVVPRWARLRRRTRPPGRQASPPRRIDDAGDLPLDRDRGQDLPGRGVPEPQLGRYHSAFQLAIHHTPEPLAGGDGSQGGTVGAERHPGDGGAESTQRLEHWPTIPNPNLPVLTDG